MCLERPDMNLSKNLIPLVLLLLGLTSPAWAQLDSRLVGNWGSSSGAQIVISYPNEDNTNLVLLSVNGGTPIRAELEGGDMDSIILTYTARGSTMKGYYDPVVKEISIYEGYKKYSTWKRR